MPRSSVLTGISSGLRKSWDERPLAVIMALAVFFRLLAAVFARGWGMLDDQFLIIEPASSWACGHDYNAWLPGSPRNTGPSGHNFFYPGIHFLLFTVMNWFHLSDMQVRMMIVRMLHAAFSLFTVWYGYRITETLSDRRSARLAGILLAIYFFMPWTSVRTLAETTCIPFLVLGFWQLINPRNEERIFRAHFLAGLFFGLATDFRYQLVLFPAGVMIFLLFMRKWKEPFILFLGFFCSFVVVQTAIDLFLWGYPFAELLGYIRTNITDRNSYFVLPWYNYFLTVGGILLPPVSLFLFYGFFRGWRRWPLLFFPALLFFAFHSWFPNKQERFILPFIPVFVMTGVMGYHRYLVPSKFWANRKKLLRGCWIFFWVINLAGLTGLTVMYTKRAQVEAMYYLSRYPYLQEVILEDENAGVPVLPLSYTGKYPDIPDLLPNDTTIYQQVQRIALKPKFFHPQFFLLTGGKNLEKRVALARESFPQLVYETTIEPGFIDILMHRLNPVNKANHIYIFRNREFYKNRLDK